jgi:hypothetical protein
MRRLKRTLLRKTHSSRKADGTLRLKKFQLKLPAPGQGFSVHPLSPSVTVRAGAYAGLHRRVLNGYRGRFHRVLFSRIESRRPLKIPNAINRLSIR